MASLPIRKMHLLRTALVNADLLAFLCMNLALEDHFTHTATTAATRERRYGRQGPSAVTPEVVAKPEPFPLWRFMRLGSRKLALERDAAVTRERRLRSAIWARLRQGDRYPWAHFARVKAPKPMSDMVEALIGAIWVDSLPTRDYNGGSDSGSMAAVDAFLSRLGLLQLLDRFLADKVDVIHPKEELCTRLATHPESKPWWEVYDLTLPQPSAGFAVNGSQPELPVDWDGRTAAVGRAGGEEAADGDDGPDDCWAMQGDFACRMHVGDELIAHVRGCIDKKEAIIRAAEVAVAKFRARAAAAVTAAAGEHMGEKAFISDLCGDVAFAVQSIEV